MTIDRTSRTPAALAAVMADGSAQLTRVDLESRSVRLARHLRASGLADGDRVAILMENRLDWFVAMWAVRRAHLRFVPVNWHLKADEIRYVVENSNARALITSGQLRDLAAAAVDRLPAVTVLLTTGDSGAGFANLAEATWDYPSTPQTPEIDGGAMPYSSGTSGRPKGVLRAMGEVPFGTPVPLESMLRDLYALDEASVYLSPAPTYHASPVSWTNAVLMFGGTVVLVPAFDAEATLAAIERYRVTHAQFVPTHFVRLLKLPPEVRARYDLSSLTTVVHAAAPCAPRVKRQMIDWLGPIVFEYYSSSERCGFTAIDAAEWLTHPGSVGRSRGGAIHILDADTHDELPTGANGVIYFENAVPFTYHGEPEKTAEALNAEGWGTQGDIGHVDEEGYLYLADRLSHMIISGGVNIYPQETENALSEHPAVADVAVIGVPNDDFGEEVKAVVELDPAADAPDPAELIAFCRDRIAGYKCPKSVDFVATLPRHPNGKLLKRELRDRYWPTAARI